MSLKTEELHSGIEKGGFKLGALIISPLLWGSEFGNLVEKEGSDNGCNSNVIKGDCFWPMEDKDYMMVTTGPPDQEVQAKIFYLVLQRYQRQDLLIGRMHISGYAKGSAMSLIEAPTPGYERSWTETDTWGTGNIGRVSPKLDSSRISI